MTETNFPQVMEKPEAKDTTGVNWGPIDNGRENFDDKQQNDQIEKSGLSKKKKLGVTRGDKINERTVDQGIDLVESG